jgi:hypothetical protein
MLEDDHHLFSTKFKFFTNTYVFQNQNLILFLLISKTEEDLHLIICF